MDSRRISCESRGVPSQEKGALLQAAIEAADTDEFADVLQRWPRHTYAPCVREWGGGEVGRWG
jgi:hypothetical protein